MKKYLLILSFLFGAQLAFAAVTRDANGWTIVTASSDSRIVYVSNSTGNDANNGLSPATAKKTIAAGIPLIRNNYPDHLLLMKGDTFTNQNFGFSWIPSGRSAAEPILIGSYGTGDRPKILSGTDHGFRNAAGTLYSGSNIVIMGLYFEPHTRVTLSPTNPGITFAARVRNVLIEDCYITGFSGNISLGAGGTEYNIQIRRNVIVNAWSASSHSQGMYASDVDTLLIEENIFDHNGYHDTITTAEKTIYNHSMYITHYTRNVTIRNNISSRPSSIGLKFQPNDGTHYISDNIFVQCGAGLQVGGGQAASQAGYPGATIYANNNIIIEGNNHPAGGMGVSVSNVKRGSFSNNIIANKAGTGTQFALSLQDGKANWESIGCGIRNFMVENNIIYNWRGVSRIERPTQSYNGGPIPIIDSVYFRNNIFQDPTSGGARLQEIYTTDTLVAAFTGNKYYSSAGASNWFGITGSNRSLTQWTTSVEPTAIQQQVSFTDSSRTVTKYATDVLGLNNYDEFIDSLKLQSKNNWRNEYMVSTISCWIKAGFDKGITAPVIAGNNSICQGNNVNLSASGGSNYQWSNGATTANITVSPAVTTLYSVTVSANGCSATSGHIITVNTCTGIEEIADNALSVYPNPASNELNFAFKSSSVGAIVIQDIMGKKIEMITTEGATHTTLNTANYSPGIYCYTAEMKEGKGAAGKFCIVK